MSICQIQAFLESNKLDTPLGVDFAANRQRTQLQDRTATGTFSRVPRGPRRCELWSLDRSGCVDNLSIGINELLLVKVSGHTIMIFHKGH